MPPNYPLTRWLTAVAVLFCAGSLRAEVFNCYYPLSSTDVNIFNITIAGNVIGELNLSATATDPFVNPFVAAGGTSTVGAALDGNGNTVVTFTGSIPINSSTDFIYGPTSNGEPHIGLDGSNGASIPGGGLALASISSSFSNTSGYTLNEPSPLLASVPAPSAGATDIDYLVFFTQVTDPGTTIGQWFEVPFDGSRMPSLTLTNYSANVDTLSNVGYYVSEPFIPLDQLNYGLNPPPGRGSPFNPLPALDGTVLDAGNGIGGAGGSTGPLTLPDVGVAPEPSSLTLLLTGVAGFLGYGWRRRKLAVAP